MDLAVELLGAVMMMFVMLVLLRGRSRRERLRDEHAQRYDERNR